MISILRLDRDIIGQGQALRLTRLDSVIDFRQYTSSIMVGLEFPRTATSGAINYIVSNVRVIDDDEIEIRIDQVGSLTTSQVRPGTYRVWAKIGVLWLGDGDRQLRVQVQPVLPAPSPAPAPPTAPVPTPPATTPAPASFVNVLAMSVILALRSLPNRTLSILGVLYTRMANAIFGLAMRNPGLLGVVPGGGPGPAVPPARGGGGSSSAAGAASAAMMLKPYADGKEVFPQIANLIEGANKLCWLTTWGFDEDIRFSASGQNDANTRTAVEQLKAHAIDMANLAEQRVSTQVRRRVYSNIRLLVWDATLDDDYSGSGNDLGDMSITWVDWRSVRSISSSGIGPHLRSQNLSGESHKVCEFIHGLYRRLRHPPTTLPYPSGVMTVTQNHTTSSVFGSQHQKFLVTESSAYIGGLNFHKDYWDDRDHSHSNSGRESSRGFGSGDSGSGPLHDTGSVLSHVGCQRRLMRMFGSRWDQSTRRSGAYEGVVRKVTRLLNQSNDTVDQMIYRELIRYLRTLRRPLIGSNWMRASLQTMALSNASVDDIRITFSLPKGTAWAGSSGVKESFDEYITALGRTGGAQSLVWIENQYFKDARIAVELLKRWKTVGNARELPYAHIVIPYIPDTHWADISIPFLRDSEKKKVIVAEFQNIRWLEIRTMKILLEDDGTGKLLPRFEIGDPENQITIAGGAQNDPTRLKENTAVTITDAVDVNDPTNIIPSMTLRADEIMTQSDIVGYTLVMNDRTPSGSDARDKQRNFLKEHGIYVHSKCSIFLNDENGSAQWATVGSTNLNERSLEDNGDQDSECNVWWTHSTRVKEFFQDLCAEHLNENDPSAVNGIRIQDDGLDTLNRIRTSATPRRHLCRVDVADRLAHLG